MTLRYRIWLALQSGDKTTGELVKLLGARSNAVSCAVCNMIAAGLVVRSGFAAQLVPGAVCRPDGRGNFKRTKRPRQRENPTPYAERWVRPELEKVWPSVRVA